MESKGNTILKNYICITMFVLATTMAFAQNDLIVLNAGKNYLIQHSNTFLPIVEPHLAVNPKDRNHMVVTAMVFDSAAPTTSGDHIVVFATKDGGKSWKQTDLEMTHGGDPWVAIKDDNSAMLIALAAFKDRPGTSLVYYSSTDGGFSWNKDAVRLGGGHDHPTMQKDPNSNRLYLLSSLINRNTAGDRISYVYLNYSDDWINFKDSTALYSIGKNNSNTLTAAVHPSGPVILPYIEHQFENHSAGHTEHGSSSSIKYVYSKDDSNFQGPYLITDKIGIAKGFAVMAIDTRGKYKGRMYFVKNTGTVPERSQGLFVKYADHLEGPWSEDIRIDHNDKEEKFIRTSAIAINHEGVVGVAWIDRRNDPQLKKNDIYFTVSVNGGKSFEKEIRVSDVSSDPLVPGNGKTGERFMSGGDYMGLESKPDGSFQVVWADSRTGVFQLYTSNITIDRKKK